MKTLLIARIRHLILGPGRHRRRAKRPISPDFRRMAPMEWTLMFSGQSADRKHYPEKNGCRQEYIVR